MDLVKKAGYTPSESSLRMALGRADFIATVKKSQTGQVYRQKYPSMDDDSQSNDFENILKRLHPEIKKSSLQLFKNKHYPESTMAAFKKINNMVKRKSGLNSEDGKSLMLKAFSKNSPILKLNPLLSQSDEDEQEGFMHLFAGSIQGIRNPRAHEELKQNPWITIEYLCLASVLAKIIDKSTT